MIVAELARNTDFFAGLTPYAPFVKTGFTKYYEFANAWGSALGDEITTTGSRRKVLQVSKNYLTGIDRVETLAECVSTEMTWYFDKAIQQIWIHLNHDDSQFTCVLDYGYAMGFCSENRGVVYIDDIEYLPLIKSIPSIEQECDVIGASKPTGVTGSIDLSNVSVPDPITGMPRGEMDFLIDEPVFGNEVLLYTYKNDVLTKRACFIVEDYEHSVESVSLNLQDKRFA